MIMEGSASGYFNTPLYYTNNSPAISKLMELTYHQTEIIKKYSMSAGATIRVVCWLLSKK